MAPSVQRRKVWLTLTTLLLCSNAAKTRRPLKFGGVPQTGQPISAAGRPKFTILWGHVEDILLLTKFFSDCRYVPSLRRYSPTKLCDGAQMAILATFCVLCFQRAACSRFQTPLLFAFRKTSAFKLLQVLRREGSAATVAYVEYICISGQTYELTEPDSDTDETGRKYLRVPWTAVD